MQMFEGILFTIYLVSGIILFAGALRLRIALKRFKSTTHVSSVDMVDNLPSVSVCIPARNEGHAMTDCLERVIASNYPKLEMIVLDDLSGDKTSSLIKAFAHDGVRFVEGDPLPAGWLGKNHALNELLQEASGTYVLFMDVDTRLSPDSIEQLVAYAVQEKASMVSVLPRREAGFLWSVVFSPLRYFWELMFHQRSAPAVASSAWLIHREQFIEAFTDFSTMKTAVQPEAVTAARFMDHGRYRFLISTPLLGITYEKRWQSQVETSMRLLYPLLGMKLSHAVIAILDLIIISLPLFLVILALMQWDVWFIGAILLYVGYAALYGTYLFHVWKHFWWLGALLWPLISLQEAGIILLSVMRYRSGRITWKGRLVRLSSKSAPTPEV